MKKILLALLVITLISCTKQSILSEELPIPKTANKTSAIRDTREFDWTGSQLPNPCTGELMTATLWHVTITIQQIFKDGKSMFDSHIKGELKLIGTSGRLYTGSTQAVTKITHVEANITSFSIQIHEVINTPGSKNNLHFTTTCRYKIDKDGNIQVIPEPITNLYCR